MSLVGDVLDREVLGEIASRLAAAQQSWEARSGTVPTERCYERILLTDTHEAWLICWPTGTELDLHDHGNSSGAFSLVAGHLEETTVVDGEVRTRRLGAGDTASFGPGYVHGVSNRTDLPATSVHVYSPPLGWMDFYEVAESGDLVTARHDPGSWA